MLRKKYDLKEALMIIIDKFKDYIDVADVEVHFGLNDSEEMGKLLDELVKRGIVDANAESTRNSISGNFHIEKAREVLAEIS